MQYKSLLSCLLLASATLSAGSLFSACSDDKQETENLADPKLITGTYETTNTVSAEGANLSWGNIAQQISITESGTKGYVDLQIPSYTLESAAMGTISVGTTNIKDAKATLSADGSVVIEKGTIGSTNITFGNQEKKYNLTAKYFRAVVQPNKSFGMDLTITANGIPVPIKYVITGVKK